MRVKVDWLVRGEQIGALGAGVFGVMTLVRHRPAWVSSHPDVSLRADRPAGMGEYESGDAAGFGHAFNR